MASAPVEAHSFGQTYTLPVPVWLYLYGAAAALIVSFLLVGYFVTAPQTQPLISQKNRRWKVPPGVLAALRMLSVAILLFTIVAGFVGSNHPYRNINMTLFWVIFCLGFTWLTALAGNWFAVLNPWRILVDWLEALLPGRFAGQLVWPEKLAYWPALVLYAGFIWLELFGRSAPFSLSLTLCIYALFTLAACVVFGKTYWFAYGEFFSVFLRVIAKVAPLQVITDSADGDVYLQWRRPFSDLIQQRPVPFSLLVFILFVLASTAFDGLHETALWIGAFWKHLYLWVLIPLYGNAPPVPFPTIQKLYLVYQTLALLLIPLFCLVGYILFIALARIISRSQHSLAEFGCWFAYSLLPIALAYHVTHYFTLLQVQGAQLIRLVSDPFALGWNLFGTARMPVSSIPDMNVVWHTQVALILIGHIISVYLAHRQALQIFADRRAAIVSQLPMLVMMVGFTTAGLWILSLPHGAGVMD
ncbi:hypothetical protein [Litorivivens sp.]|uniref:hypothetical protein n=1 Tax=Litorivivens sp. TaxID=2020868 RepID=UPI0035633FC5